MNKNILLSGVGGQGTVLASKLLAQAAMNRGEFARTAETIGMAQRGGCVVSHVRIGGVIHSPLIPYGDADMIIGFEPVEAVRCLDFLKPGGVVVVSRKAIAPVTASLSGSDYSGEEMLDFLKEKVERLLILDAGPICESCGTAKVLNVALLGAALSTGVLELSIEEMKRTITERVPERFAEMNLKALELGAASGMEE